MNFIFFVPYMMSADTENLKSIVEQAWENRELLKEEKTITAIKSLVEEVDKGRIRVAEPGEGEHGWKVNEWVKKGVILYFPIMQMTTDQIGSYEICDKIPLKTDLGSQGIRAVMGSVLRYGAFINSGVIVMPGFVNIGAYVDTGTMVDTWATVGSCAQIGKNVHLSGGVGIGGVLEPVQAAPVIIEDDCFIGSRCIIVEGAHIAKEAVIGAGVTITNSTKIIDVTGKEPVIYKGHVPERCVVIPGSYEKEFPAGKYHVPCAMIIGRRKASTDLKTSLNSALREFNVSV